MPVTVPRPLTPTYFVGVVSSPSDGRPVVTTPAYQNPVYRTSMAFAFADPGRAGMCLAAVCRVLTIKDALTAAMSSGYTPVQSPAAGDANVGTLCRPGDMWACVIYDGETTHRKIKNSMLEVKRLPPTNPPRIYYGFHGDIDKPLYELRTAERDTVLDQAETFFLFAHLANVG